VVNRILHVLRAALRAPLDDLAGGLRAIGDGGPTALALALGGYVASWWVYVPIHELLHAFACIGTGGRVTRLEIDGVYGAAFLKRVFPFVAVGSDFGGRLTGFDTHGSDLVYLATDIAPFLLTVFLAIPALRASTRAAWPPRRRALVFGAALPVALAPFLSLGGDYYEMGSIVVSRAAASLRPGLDLARWRSDDLGKLASTLLRTEGAGIDDAIGVASGAALGAVLAVATYTLGCAWAAWLRGRIAKARPSTEGGQPQSA
jgi:hypothetical protein